MRANTRMRAGQPTTDGVDDAAPAGGEGGGLHRGLVLGAAVQALGDGEEPDVADRRRERVEPLEPVPFDAASSPRCAASTPPRRPRARSK